MGTDAWIRIILYFKSKAFWGFLQGFLTGNSIRNKKYFCIISKMIILYFLNFVNVTIFEHKCDKIITLFTIYLFYRRLSTENGDFTHFLQNKIMYFLLLF